MLNKNDRVLLLVVGKKGTISGNTGKWVKVIYNKDEIGWVFDAYLKYE